jgi:hypothetical protein
MEEEWLESALGLTLPNVEKDASNRLLTKVGFCYVIAILSAFVLAFMQEA